MLLSKRSRHDPAFDGDESIGITMPSDAACAALPMPLLCEERIERGKELTLRCDDDAKAMDTSAASTPSASPAPPAHASASVSAPPPTTSCLRASIHSTYTREQLVQLLASVRVNFCLCCAQGLFTLTNLEDKRLTASAKLQLRACQDPCGVVAAAVTIVRFAYTYRVAIRHNLDDEARGLCAAALLLAQKCKNEQSWPEGRSVASEVMRLFLSPEGNRAKTTDELHAHLFAYEAELLLNLPLHALVDDNVQTAAEQELGRLLDAGALTADGARAALGRVSFYFYANAASLHNDVFEEAAALSDLSTDDMGRALVRVALLGTNSYAATDSYASKVRAFSQRLASYALRAPALAQHPDGQFLRKERDREWLRLGTRAT